MTPIRALMVDLDGTLARTAEANLQAYTQALQQAGVPIVPADLEARIQGRHWKEFLPAILGEAGSNADPAAIAARKSQIYAANLHLIEVNTGLVQLLTACGLHLKTALVTSAAAASVHALLRAHNLDKLFHTIVTGDDVQRHKPDPEAYRTAAARLGVHPEETLIYEDSDIGVASAKAFGGHVIRVIF